MDSATCVLLAFALSVSLTMSAFAQTTCSVRTLPEDAGTSWQRAARQALAQTESLPATQRDCREIVLRVPPSGGASVAITTLDGRTAARPVAGPEDVVPVVRALLVTLPQAAAPLAEKTTQASIPPARAPVSDASPADARASGASGPHVMAVAGGGARTGLPWRPVSPAARLSAGALLGRFELGVFGSREFGYGVLGANSPAGFGMAATSVGLFSGFRQPFGWLALIAGLELSASFVREQVMGMNMTIGGTGNGQSMDINIPGVPIKYGSTEGRVGAYLAATLPLRFRIRLRPQLGIDATPLRVRHAVPAGTTLPSLHRWGGTLMLAIEGTLL